MKPSELYKVIKPTRTKLAWTQEQLARKAKLTDASHLHKIENNQQGCSLKTMDRIFKALGISLEWVIANDTKE